MGKDMTEEELQKHWRNTFVEEFKKAFGDEEFQKSCVAESKKHYDEEDFILILNYYGIKSPWM